MPIDFRCQCGRTLRVPDNAAGKSARCPSCGDTVTIPESSTLEPPLDESSFGESSSPGERNPFANPVPPAEGSDDPNANNPYASPSTPNVAPTATFPTGTYSTEIRNEVVDVSTIFDFALQIWKNNLGLLAGTGAVIMVVNMGFSSVSSGLQMYFEQARNPDAAIVAVVAISLLSNIAQMFLQIGQTQICLSLARGQRTEFSQLFGGGPRFLPVLGISICLGVIVSLGLLMCIVPGIIFALMWWPCYCLVVDDKAGVFKSFGVAQVISENNKGTVVLLWLLSIAIVICGLLACCIGVIFAAPLTTVLFVTAYLMMSGQIPAQTGLPQHSM